MNIQTGNMRNNYIYIGKEDFKLYGNLIVSPGHRFYADKDLVYNITLMESKVHNPSNDMLKSLLSNSEPYEVYIARLNKDIFPKLIQLGILKTSETSCRDNNVGTSDYSKHIIQPWSIWLDYKLNPWDADIVKRVLRTKEEPNMTKNESRISDYKKIIHICNERIRQLSNIN